MSFFSVYKPGQGYWTRVMTAVGVGILVLCGAYWFADDPVKLLLDAASKVRWTTPEFVQAVAAWGKANGQDIQGLKSLDTIEFDKSRKVFVIKDKDEHTYSLQPAQAQQALDAAASRPGAGPRIGQAPLTVNLVEKRRAVELGLPASPNGLYIKVGVGTTIVVAFTILMWWLLNKPNIVEFAIATEAEMRKVNWPTRREVTGSTWIVVCGTLLMAVFLYACDLIFAQLFQWMRIL